MIVETAAIRERKSHPHPLPSGAIAATVWLVFAFATAAAAEMVVVRGGSLLDVASGQMRPERTILIDKDRIRAVGTPEHPITIPDGAHVIDVRGKYVIPGLIDGHAHVVAHLDFAHVNGGEILPLFLANGVTTLRCVGDAIVAQAGVAYYAQSHPDLCPRIFLASSLIDRDPPIHPNWAFPVNDPERIPALVEDMLGWGVTTLKIYAGTGRPVGRRVIEEGHRHGLMVTGHLSGYTAQDAVADGIDCLEHIESVFDFLIPPDPPDTMSRYYSRQRASVDLNNPKAKALVTMLADRKVMVCPTLVVFRNMLYLSDLEEIHQHPDLAPLPARLTCYWNAYPHRSGLPPDTVEVRRRQIRKYQELTGILHRAGVPLLVGTDTPCPYVPPGFAIHQELELLVESGLTPAAALKAATMHNAFALQQSTELGSIEAGKLADMVILAADPTKDIRNTRTIELVIRGGLVCCPARLLNAVPAR
jgi:hypothetical protein